MEITRTLPPIAISALLTNKVKKYFADAKLPHLEKSILSVFVKNSSIQVQVSDIIAQSEIRMHGESIMRIALDTLGPSGEFSLRIRV